MSNQRVLFWRGCTLRNITPSTTTKIEYILKKAGLSVITMSEEGCCGYPLLLAGYEEKFRENASKVVEKISSIEHDVLVTHCPGCLRTFTQFYPQGALSPKILHTTQLLWQLIHEKAIELKKRVDMRVSYHDPCDLGRHMGIYEEPRKILKSIPGVILLELPEISTGKYSRCCGGGGLLRLLLPPLASQIAVDRIIEDMAGLDVQAITTACPTCVKSLMDAATVVEFTQGTSLRVLDVVDLVYDALG